MIDAIRRRWAGLSGRERMVVAAGGLVVAVSLLFVLVVGPLLEQGEVLDRQIARKQRALRDLAAIGAEYAVARAHVARLEERMAAGQGKFSLLPYLEEAASAAQVRDRIVAMQPQIALPAQGYKETSVELRLEGVALPQLLNLLVRLEDAPYLLQVKRFQVKPRFDAPHLVEATLLVSAYEKE
jgi:general secretion pathway protein M